MTDSDLSSICAYRALESLFGKVEVWMEVPVIDAGGQDYRCRYRIKGPRTDRVAHAIGADAFQALQLAMERIGIDLFFSEEGQSGDLRWLDVPYDTGFPVPASIRDLIRNDKA
jgi:hypothetical protein